MSIGFKEWAVICEALGAGTQSLILRKGGIAEGRAGFRFQHEAFYLFPTWFHEQVKNTRLPQDTLLPEKREDMISIRYFARVEWAELVTDRDKVTALEPFHIHSAELVEQRFKYDDVQGINVALVRVFRLPQAWNFPDKPAYGGCRSWVTLPDPPEMELVPVMTDAAHAKLVEEFQRIIS